MRRYPTASLALAAILLTGAASAQDTACKTTGVNGIVALVLCPPGLDETAWKDAGTAACEGVAPCAAWIWDDAAAMPAEAPPTHEDLTAEQVQSAKAIWVNDTGQLLTLGQGAN